MSTTKLPEAFERKSFNHARRSDAINHEEAKAWARGYNSALEATGAKELWEALQDILPIAQRMQAACEKGDVLNFDNDFDMADAVDYAERIAKAIAALSKSNPSNTVG